MFSSLGLICVINIIIAIILHRASHESFDWYPADEKLSPRGSSANMINKKISLNNFQYPSSKSSSITTDTSQAIKRRTSAQVTRMLLAVTLSLIIFNIPNTIMFIFSRIHDRKQLLHGRNCLQVSDSDIKSYRINFYISVIQDILSDLPHIVNFFLYCMAGKKFRSIFIQEVENCCIDLHLIERKQRRFTNRGGNMNIELVQATNGNSNNPASFVTNERPPSKTRNSILYNATNQKAKSGYENLNDSTHDEEHFLEISLNE